MLTLKNNNNITEKLNDHTNIKSVMLMRITTDTKLNSTILTKHSTNNYSSKNIVLRPLYELILILWKHIPRFPQYIVSNFGVVINVTSSKRIKAHVTRDGYARLNLNCGIKKKQYKFLLSRLVGIVYIPNPFDLPTVDHRNRNRLDNYVDNLF